MQGTVKEPESATSGRTSVHVFYTNPIDRIHINRGQSISAKHVSLMSVSPYKGQALEAYMEGKLTKSRIGLPNSITFYYRGYRSDQRNTLLYFFLVTQIKIILDKICQGTRTIWRCMPWDTLWLLCKIKTGHTCSKKSVLEFSRLWLCRRVPLAAGYIGNQSRGQLDSGMAVGSYRSTCQHDSICSSEQCHVLYSQFYTAHRRHYLAVCWLVTNRLVA